MCRAHSFGPLPGEGCTADVIYARDRLVRGLASSRLGARQGFAAALTALLAAVDAVTPADVLGKIETLIPLADPAQAVERKDALLDHIRLHCLGRLWPCDW